MDESSSWVSGSKKRVLIELSDEENQAPAKKLSLGHAPTPQKNIEEENDCNKIDGQKQAAAFATKNNVPVDKASTISAATLDTKDQSISDPKKQKLSLSLHGNKPRVPATQSLKALFARAAATVPSTSVNNSESLASTKITTTKVELVPAKIVTTPTKPPSAPKVTPTKKLAEDDLLASMGVSTSPLFSGPRPARAAPSILPNKSGAKKPTEDGARKLATKSATKDSSYKKTSPKPSKSSDSEEDEGESKQVADTIESSSCDSNEVNDAKKQDLEDADEDEGDAEFAAAPPDSPIFEIKSDDDGDDIVHQNPISDPIESDSDVEELASPKPKPKPVSDLSSWLKKPGSAGTSASSTEPDLPGEPLKLSETHQIPAVINKKLRDYQREGVKFLYNLFKDDKGGILADDMGLGKTIQTIAFISAIMFHQTSAGNWLVPRPGARSVLVVAPATVLEQWQSECQKWKLRPNSAKIYRGVKSKRKSLYLLAKQGPPIIVITSYETMKNDIDDLLTIDWEFIIMDEVHKIKGKDTKVKDAAHRFKTMRRYGLTGTLLQNNLDELWVLMDWATSSRFCTFPQMRDGFIQPIKNGQRQECTKRELALGRSASKKLKEKLSEFVLRRDKKIIADKLPSKEDRIVFCPLTEMQMKVYKRILELPEIVALKESARKCFCGSNKSRSECHGSQYAPDGVTILKDLVLYVQTMLGKVCNHLQLMAPNPGKESKPDAALKVLEFMKKSFGDEVLEQYRKCIQTDDHLALSGKICVLKTLLPEWFKQGHKVLLFSKSTRMLDIIEKLLRTLRLSFCRLDGTTPAIQRQRIVDEFNKTNFRTKFIFLLSTKAGGLGLNLVSANIVVVFDPNWNASHDLQAQDRAYRIGQTKDTKVFRLVATGTIEELMYQRQVYKQQLHNITIHGQYEKRWFKGVQGVKGEEGDLFGILNLLTLSEEKVITQEIMKRTDEMYKDFQMETNQAVDEEGNNAELKSLMEDNFDDADKLVKEVQEEDQQRMRAIMQNPDDDLLRRAGVLYSHNNQSLLGDNAVERRLSAAAEREVATEEAFRSQFPPVPPPSQRYVEPSSRPSSQYSAGVDRPFPAAPNTPAYRSMASKFKLGVSARYNANSAARFAEMGLPPISASPAPAPTSAEFKHHPYTPPTYAPAPSPNAPRMPPSVYGKVPGSALSLPATPSFDSLKELEAMRARKAALLTEPLKPEFRQSIAAKANSTSVVDLSDS